MSVAVKKVYKDIPFIVAPYHADDQSALRPDAPGFCPKNLSKEHLCQLKFKGWRHRKCGPGFPLSIWKCTEDKASFTIYPPGWEPYGREASLELAPDGGNFTDDQGDIDVLTDSVFSAAIDAATGKMWPASTRSEEYDKGVFKTQKRHIDGILKLLGIAPDMDDQRREIVTSRLGIPLSSLNKSWKKIRDGPATWREKGLQILVLLCPQPLFRHSASIQVLGSSVDFWGQPNHY